MPHEKIDLKELEWAESRPLVEYELNRAHTNIHDFRNIVNAQNLENKEHMSGVERTANSNAIRLAVIEAKIIIYGSIAGAIGMLVAHYFLK